MYYFLIDDESQSTVEYAVLIGLLSVLAVYFAYVIGNLVIQLFSENGKESSGTPVPEPPVPSSLPSGS